MTLSTLASFPGHPDFSVLHTEKRKAWCTMSCSLYGFYLKMDVGGEWDHTPQKYKPLHIFANVARDPVSSWVPILHKSRSWRKVPRKAQQPKDTLTRLCFNQDHFCLPSKIIGRLWLLTTFGLSCSWRLKTVMRLWRKVKVSQYSHSVVEFFHEKWSHFLSVSTGHLLYCHVYYIAIYIFFSESVVLCHNTSDWLER